MHGTAFPRNWAALEPHFPRASHSRPAHSSRGLEAYSQLAFPRKPRLRAFPWILRVAHSCNLTPLEAAVPHIPTQLDFGGSPTLFGGFMNYLIE